MSMALEFRAHCARGHDRIDFTDRQVFDAHMIGEHHYRKPYAGAPLDPRFAKWIDPSRRDKAAPGWANGRILGPHPWTPARRTVPIHRVAVRVAAGEYTWPGIRPWDERQPAGEIPEDQWERVS